VIQHVRPAQKAFSAADRMTTIDAPDAPTASSSASPSRPSASMFRMRAAADGW